MGYKGNFYQGVMHYYKREKEKAIQTQIAKMFVFDVFYENTNGNSLLIFAFLILNLTFEYCVTQIFMI